MLVQCSPLPPPARVNTSNKVSAGQSGFQEPWWTTYCPAGDKMRCCICRYSISLTFDFVPFQLSHDVLRASPSFTNNFPFPIQGFREQLHYQNAVSECKSYWNLVVDYHYASGTDFNCSCTNYQHSARFHPWSHNYIAHGKSCKTRKCPKTAWTHSTPSASHPCDTRYMEDRFAGHFQSSWSKGWSQKNNERKLTNTHLIFFSFTYPCVVCRFVLVYISVHTSQQNQKYSIADVVNDCIVSHGIRCGTGVRKSQLFCIGWKVN